MYNILEARIEFLASIPQRITVLVEISPNDVRAIYATTQPRAGYTHIPLDATISDELLQHIAGYGCETLERDKIFLNWEKKYLLQKIDVNTVVSINTEVYCKICNRVIPDDLPFCQVSDCPHNEER